jgi:hypothetical protein
MEMVKPSNILFSAAIFQQKPGLEYSPGYNAAMLKKSQKFSAPLFPGPLTARAAVLAVLLSDQDQTGAAPLQGRVSLAAIVRILKRKYHWPIETSSFPANAADGRATWATVYSLEPEVIAAALAAGGREWLESRRTIKNAKNRA